jgi:hypothetical protein
LERRARAVGARVGDTITAQLVPVLAREHPEHDAGAADRDAAADQKPRPQRTLGPLLGAQLGVARAAFGVLTLLFGVLALPLGLRSVGTLPRGVLLGLSELGVERGQPRRQMLTLLDIGHGREVAA